MPTAPDEIPLQPGWAGCNPGSQISRDTSPACRLWPRAIVGNAGQNRWRTVGKLGDQRKIPAHGLNRFSERGQREIAPLFEARNTVLGDPERLGYLYLRKLARVPQLAQGHLLGDQFTGPGLDLLALGGLSFFILSLSVIAMAISPSSSFVTGARQIFRRPSL